MPLDPSDLTDRQALVYPHFQKGVRIADAARATGLDSKTVFSAYRELSLLEHVGGRATGAEAIAREKAQAEQMAKLPVCGRCSLREPHVCVGSATDYLGRREVMW